MVGPAAEVVIGVAFAAVAAVEAGFEQEQEQEQGLVPGYKQTGGLLIAVGNAAEKCSARPLPQHLKSLCTSKLARNHHHHGKREGDIRLYLTRLHPSLLNKSLTIIPESPNMLSQVIVELPPNFNVGEDLLVLQICIIQFL